MPLIQYQAETCRNHVFLKGTEVSEVLEMPGWQYNQFFNQAASIEWWLAKLNLFLRSEDAEFSAIFWFKMFQ